ncbi:MAG TPA: hypothetical protein VNZ26_26225 [Vicinamibacterales bacterium]|jgi:hypothetical protein|nr:hypothetical protein [Vicinamibacterales bacterium]
MVDALSRSSRWVQPTQGCVIDLRPADVIGAVEIGLPGSPASPGSLGSNAGSVLGVGVLTVQDERRRRYAAANAAVREVVESGVLRVTSEQTFWFYHYPESPDELRDFIATKWQQTTLDPETHQRAIDMLARYPNGRLRLREHVVIRTLQPGTARVAR